MSNFYPLYNNIIINLECVQSIDYFFSEKRLVINFFNSRKQVSEVEEEVYIQLAKKLGIKVIPEYRPEVFKVEVKNE